MADENESKYIKAVLDPIKVCANYKPKFGQGTRGGGLSLDQFRQLYGSDPFYSWFGLDNPLMYSAHKAAGGMTSIYRQIGIGCEALFREVLKDALGLEDVDVNWSYNVPVTTTKFRTLQLDGRIPLDKIRAKSKKQAVTAWIDEAAADLGIKKTVAQNLNGIVFEVRQGYKSKDAKRQNADIANAATAYANAYLPCALILSNQIDPDILIRYRAEKWAVVTGVAGTPGPHESTYQFMRDVVGYDLAAFFRRNKHAFSSEIDAVLKALLVPKEGQ